ncbi:hypothetical protein EXIGLDRAFT_762787 [Exidia glandulosa HHB12029]|uniref:Uncharacterized protein n=1 Tax=Exidia glandulosa HHB12029 TaxID=1314781 RepID=A0A165MH51_EXIGL|nr:hypothetical protein EXIGLDRAFT_762787 [Exidia glandulosa HHB12029]
MYSGHGQHPFGAPAPPAVNPAAGLCCGSVQPHVPVQTHWEPQFASFLQWLAHNAAAPTIATVPQGYDFVVRLTTTINFGRSCGTMEYMGMQTPHGYTFLHVGPEYGRTHGYTDRCAFKNYKCMAHSLYFQLDLHKR